MLRRKTRRDRMCAALKAIKEELRRRWHHSIPEQGKWLRQVVQGYFNYHSVPTNSSAMFAFRAHVTDLWRRALRRRSQQDDTTWVKMNRLAKAWLPPVQILHPWPVVRFTAKYPRQEPGARIAHAGICAGGGVSSNDHSYRNKITRLRRRGARLGDREITAQYGSASRKIFQKLEFIFQKNKRATALKRVTL